MSKGPFIKQIDECDIEVTRNAGGDYVVRHRPAGSDLWTQGDIFPERTPIKAVNTYIERLQWMYVKGEL